MGLIHRKGSENNEAEDWTIVDVRKNIKMNRTQAGTDDLVVNIDRSKAITAKKKWTIFRNKFLLSQKTSKVFIII